MADPARAFQEWTEQNPGLAELGNTDFLNVLVRKWDIHCRKAAGYSGSDNPDTWANFRVIEKIGLTPFIGIIVRMGDKWARIQNLVRKPENDMVGETIVETLLDLSNYSDYAVCLWEEAQQATLAAKIDDTMRKTRVHNALAGWVPEPTVAEPVVMGEDDGHLD